MKKFLLLFNAGTRLPRRASFYQYPVKWPPLNDASSTSQQTLPTNTQRWYRITLDLLSVVLGASSAVLSIKVSAGAPGGSPMVMALAQAMFMVFLSPPKTCDGAPERAPAARASLGQRPTFVAPDLGCLDDPTRHSPHQVCQGASKGCDKGPAETNGELHAATLAHRPVHCPSTNAARAVSLQSSRPAHDHPLHPASIAPRSDLSGGARARPSPAVGRAAPPAIVVARLVFTIGQSRPSPHCGSSTLSLPDTAT